MSKQHVHFAAFGYEPMRMKPVHFANGFFLSLTGYQYRLEWLNKTTVIRHKSGLHDDYAPDALRKNLLEQGRMDQSITVKDINQLRIQLDGVVNNDGAVYAAFSPYSAMGNDYTIISDRLIAPQRLHDGYAGYLIYRILERSDDGRYILNFSKNAIFNHESPLEQLISPLLDDEEDRIEWDNPYFRVFGELSDKRLDNISQMMSKQTTSVKKMCENLQVHTSTQTQLRGLIIGLCSWLFLYIQKKVNLNVETPLLVMDFLGRENSRFRVISRNCYTRQRELFFKSYKKMWDSGLLDCDEEEYNEIYHSKKGFKFLEEHYNDLAIRIGFSQPRAPQAPRKHFELQPDTARLLLMSAIENRKIMKISELAVNLRDTWGIVFGGCDDDRVALQKQGYTGLDQDEDIEPNYQAFVNLLKRLNLAIDLSDGLVLCAAYPEELI